MPRCFDVYTVVNERKITENTYLKMSTRRFHSVLDTFIKLVYVSLRFDSIEISKYVYAKNAIKAPFSYGHNKKYFTTLYGQNVASLL